MAKPTPQEMMAARNPLQRAPVAAVDIYSAAPEPQEAKQETPKAKPASKTPAKTVEKKQAAEAKSTTKKLEAEADVPYSTYLFKPQIKGIKLRAIEQDVNDKYIVQQAIDEYFQHHPL